MGNRIERYPNFIMIQDLFFASRGEYVFATPSECETPTRLVSIPYALQASHSFETGP